MRIKTLHLGCLSVCGALSLAAMSYAGAAFAAPVTGTAKVRLTQVSRSTDQRYMIASAIDSKPRAARLAPLERASFIPMLARRIAASRNDHQAEFCGGCVKIG